jgi:hypothetical protein
LSWRQYHVLETPDELQISVRFLHPAMTAVMLSVLAIFWSALLFTKGREASASRAHVRHESGGVGDQFRQNLGFAQTR